MTPDQKAALDVARTLAELGVPIFLARPAMNNGQWDPAGGSGGCGYRLPKNWEKTTANPRYLEAWEPGMAVCAVMGHVLDLVDLDPRNGGKKESLNGSMPIVYAVAETPSGGYHGFVKSLGVRSRDAVLQGIDIKAGDPEGRGRGFAFIAPTVKLSKSTGELGQYNWIQLPDLDQLKKLAGDQSGRTLADIVRRAHGSKNKVADEDDAEEPRDWLIADVIPVGKRHPWLRSYAGWMRRNNVKLAEARILMRERWKRCEQPPSYPMPWEDAEFLLNDIYRRYDAEHGPTLITDWREPTSLASKVPPPLPIEACGPILGPLVAAVAKQVQVPSDMVINMVLSTITAAAQGRWKIRIEPGWTETLSVSTVTLAASGERKTPILALLTKPLVEYERKLQQEHGYDVAFRAEEIKLAQAQVDQTRKNIQRGKATNWDLQAEVESLQLLEPLYLPRLVAGDATPEALAILMAQQNGRIGVLSAEPGFFANVAGRYSRDGASNLDVVLQGTSGERIVVDRVTRDPLVINNPCLTISVCLQPGLLDALGRRPELRFAGFLARFLYVLPEPMVGRRSISVDYVDGFGGRAFADSSNSVDSAATVPNEKDRYIYTYSSIMDIWNTRLEALAVRARAVTLHETSTQSTESATTFAKPAAPALKWSTQSTELPLDEDARKQLQEYRCKLEPRLHPNTGDLASIADWGSKLPGTATRIAAALTLIENPAAEAIGHDAMSGALQLAEAYIPHVQTVLDRIRGRGDGLDQARDVLDVILRNRWSTFTQRDVHRKLEKTAWVRDARKAADTIADELETLEELGHVRMLPEGPREGAGRPKSPRYEVNPAHLEATS